MLTQDTPFVSSSFSPPTFRRWICRVSVPFRRSPSSDSFPDSLCIYRARFCILSVFQLWLWQAARISVYISTAKIQYPAMLSGPCFSEIQCENESPYSFYFTKTQRPNLSVSSFCGCIALRKLSGYFLSCVSLPFGNAVILFWRLKMELQPTDRIFVHLGLSPV